MKSPHNKIFINGNLRCILNCLWNIFFLLIAGSSVSEYKIPKSTSFILNKIDTILRNVAFLKPLNGGFTESVFLRIFQVIFFFFFHWQHARKSFVLFLDWISFTCATDVRFRMKPKTATKHLPRIMRRNRKHVMLMASLEYAQIRHLKRESHRGHAASCVEAHWTTTLHAVNNSSALGLLSLTHHHHPLLSPLPRNQIIKSSRAWWDCCSGY